MAEVIKIKRGLDIKLKGKADAKYAEAQIPDMFAVRPDDFQGITPRLAVKAGALDAHKNAALAKLCGIIGNISNFRVIKIAFCINAL